ncbi:MAG: glycogen-binding domain-containing protein [Gemmatimonadota bacterium]
MKHRAPAVAATALLVAVGGPLAAQDLSLRLGGVRARYADTLTGSAGALAGRLAWETPNLLAGFDGNYTRFTSGAWTTRFSGTALGVRSMGSGLGLGVQADVDGDYVSGGSWSGTASAGPVVAVPVGRWLAAASVTAGGLRRIDESSDPRLGASLVVRRDLGSITLDAGVAGTRAGAVRFADATLGIGFRNPAFGVAALVGARAGDLSGNLWVQTEADLRITPLVTLEAAGGTYPRDVTGFTSGVFVSLGMRVGGSVGGFAGRARSGVPQPNAERRVRVEPLAEREARVTFLMSDATDVAIAGEWNAWTPVVLTPLGRGAWQAVLPLGPGAYRFSLVVDGERWVVPTGVPNLPDGFGGSVGLLVIGSVRR